VRPEGDRERRRAMVAAQIAARGVADRRVLAALARVPRHLFVPPSLERAAYDDAPLPIGQGQTISQPYIVATMLECLSLQPEDKALEIGTGSGYQTALLAEMCRTVCTVERIPELADAARERLRGMGYENVRFRTADGTLGWPEEAPFDAIVVSAAAPRMPQPLLDQLAEGGRLAAPVGEERWQELVRVERTGGVFRRRTICGCVFVKLIGKEGWPEERE